jgi:hypothetical protein
MVWCSCHPSCAGSINRRIAVQASPGINVRPYSENNESRKDWRHCSNGRVPAQQTQGPEFILQYHSPSPAKKEKRQTRTLRLLIEKARMRTGASG